MSRAVLVDTGPLYAALDRADQYHVRAREELTRLARARLTVVVADPILLECHNLVVRRHGPEIALRWLEEVILGPRAHPTADDFVQAMERLRRFSDQRLTITDALLAVLAEQVGFPVWTFDHHFDLMRVPVWRS